MRNFLIFLIKHKKLKLDRVQFVLDDFLEDKLNTLSVREINEIERIRKKPERITSSYLFKQIEPSILPFYTKE